MIKKFYEETGMYVDWKQLSKLPRIDTLIDIGVGPNGTEDLYNHFTNAKLILIDPIDEAKEYAKKISKTRNVEFFQNALGIKVDTEGFELDVMLGASEILKYTKFVIAEVRHNHESLQGVYKLHEFMKVMSDNKFVLTTILTAKPFIADLCFQPLNELSK